MIKLTSRAVTKGLSSFLLCAVLLVPVIAESAPINTDKADIVIKGYDVVTYFTEGRPVEGKSEFEYSWQNVRWRFSTAANRDLFAANPERYAPQYGGFCAQCLVERGRLRDSNPKAWTIIDGKLYLHRSMFQRTQWRENKVSYIKHADDTWAKLTGEKAAVTRPKQDTTSAAFKIAIFPFNKFTQSPQSSTYGDTVRGVLEKLTPIVINNNRSLDLVYSYSSGEDNVDVIVDAEKIWPGRGTSHKQPNEELIYELGAELGVDAVLLFQYQPEASTIGPSNSPPQYWDVETYVFDVGLRRVYHEPVSRLASGRVRVSDVEEATSPVLSRFVESRKLTSHKIAIFPFNDSSPDVYGQYSTEDLGERTHKVIRQNSSLDLVYSYYSAKDNVDQTVDAEKIWRGTSKRKHPNEEVIYELGAELGVNAVLLLQWRVIWLGGGGNNAWDAEIYLFDIGLRRVYHEPRSRLASGNIVESDLARATSPVLSRFLEGRDKVSQAQ